MRPALDRDTLDLDALDGALTRPGWTPRIEASPPVLVPPPPPRIVAPPPPPPLVPTAPRGRRVWPLGALALVGLLTTFALLTVLGRLGREEAPAKAAQAPPTVVVAPASPPQTAPPPPPAAEPAPPPPDWALRFAYGQAEPLTDEAAPAAFRDCPAVLVVGYACALGPAEANLTLSARRAEAAARRLIASGVPAARVQTRAAGEQEPAFDNHSAAGRRLNRRAVARCVSTPPTEPRSP